MRPSRPVHRLLLPLPYVPGAKPRLSTLRTWLDLNLYGVLYDPFTNDYKSSELCVGSTYAISFVTKRPFAVRPAFKMDMVAINGAVLATIPTSETASPLQLKIPPLPDRQGVRVRVYDAGNAVSAFLGLSASATEIPETFTIHETPTVGFAQDTLMLPFGSNEGIFLFL